MTSESFMRCGQVPEQFVAGVLTKPSLPYVKLTVAKWPAIAEPSLALSAKARTAAKHPPACNGGES
jgi:hypothetical protein